MYPRTYEYAEENLLRDRLYKSCEWKSRKECQESNLQCASADVTLSKVCTQSAQSANECQHAQFRVVHSSHLKSRSLCHLSQSLGLELCAHICVSAFVANARVRVKMSKALYTMPPSRQESRRRREEAQEKRRERGAVSRSGHRRLDLKRCKTF
jgi:hypothetical protein